MDDQKAKFKDQVFVEEVKTDHGAIYGLSFYGHSSSQEHLQVSQTCFLV